MSDDLSLHIDIAATIGTDVSSRRRAGELRREIERWAACGEQFYVVLEFTDVRTISEGWADELFGILVWEHGAPWFKQHVQVNGLGHHNRMTVLDAVMLRFRHEIDRSIPKMHIKQGFSEFTPPFPVGTRIRHFGYGDGTVVGWDGNDQDPRVIIDFDQQKVGAVGATAGDSQRSMLYNFHKTHIEQI